MDEISDFIDLDFASFTIGCGHIDFTVVLLAVRELGSAMIAGIGEGFDWASGLKAKVLFGFLDHGVELTEIVTVLGHLTSGDEVMLVIDCGLHVIANGGLPSFA